MPDNRPTLTSLIEHREQLRGKAQALLERRQAAGVEQLSGPDATRFRAMLSDLADLDESIETRREDDRRGTIPEHIARLGGGGENRAANSAGRLAPLGYADEQIRRAFDAVHRGESTVLETRDPGFSGTSGLLPPELGPVLPVFPRHENRLLDRLPGVALDNLPALQYVQVTSVTGSAAVVPEGQPKPEIVIPGTPKVATARKIAAHTGLSWEAYSGDYPAFVNACQVELLKSVVDQENLSLYGGTGEANGQVNGITTDPNVLTFDASGVTTIPGPWDAIEYGIGMLRSGPALAEPNLALVTPATWSAVRRHVDSYGRYYAAPDPSGAEVNTAWGIDVLVSTQFTPGTFVLVDTTLYGRVVVRESLVTRIGYSGSDFTENIIRFVSEERLTQTIERPQAICVIKNLPTAAETKSSGRK